MTVKQMHDLFNKLIEDGKGDYKVLTEAGFVSMEAKIDWVDDTHKQVCIY